MVNILVQPLNCTCTSISLCLITIVYGTLMIKIVIIQCQWLFQTLFKLFQVEFLKVHIVRGFSVKQEISDYFSSF